MNRETGPRRIRRALVRPSMLGEILNQRIGPDDAGFVHVHTLELPRDARVAHLNWDAMHAAWWVFFESEEFEPVPEGQLVPEFDLMMTTRAARLIDQDR